MEKHTFHRTLYWASDHLSMLGLKLLHVIANWCKVILKIKSVFRWTRSKCARFKESWEIARCRRPFMIERLIFDDVFETITLYRNVKPIEKQCVLSSVSLIECYIPGTGEKYDYLISSETTLNNSLRPSDAYMRQYTKLSFVQIMACRLFGAKPLSEPVLIYCSLDPWEQIFSEIRKSMKKNTKMCFVNFTWGKYPRNWFLWLFWKMCLIYGNVSILHTLRSPAVIVKQPPKIWASKSHEALEADDINTWQIRWNCVYISWDLRWVWLNVDGLEQDWSTAVLHQVIDTQFQNDWTTEIDVIDERDFPRFEFEISFGGMSLGWPE